MEGPQLTPELKEFLEGPNHYRELRVIPGRGICGVQRMFVTTGLFFGITKDWRAGRWCYHTMAEAVSALNEWDGVGDPPGEWIKYKGIGGEYSRIPNEFDNE